MTVHEKYLPLPQPDEIPVREREDAMGGYFMMFAAIGAGFPLPMLNLIAAIIYYYINRNSSLFVKYHCLHSMIAQIPVSLLNGVAVLLAIRNLIFGLDFTRLYWSYVGLLAAVNLAYLSFSIVAAIRARAGRMYYFWFFGPLAYGSVFRARERHGRSPMNKPPL